MARLAVCETFLSLQGEGLHAGLPCFFIRLSGCNLACSYCDTAYAREEAPRMESRDALVSAWRASRAPLVQVTGGEPLFQSAALELMDALLSAGAGVLLETNGTLTLESVPDQVVKVVDWKTPGSGHPDSFLLSNLDLLGQGDQLKFVMVSRADYEWALSLVGRHSLAERCHVLFSPAWGRLAPVLLAQWILEDRAPVRFQLQLHKMLWGDERLR